MNALVRPKFIYQYAGWVLSIGARVDSSFIYPDRQSCQDECDRRNRLREKGKR